MKHKRVLITPLLLAATLTILCLSQVIILASTIEGWPTLNLVSTVSTQRVQHLDLRTDLQGNVHIVWTDETPIAESGTDFDVFYRVRFQDGTWGDTEVVTEDTTHSAYPRLAVDSIGQVHVVWIEGDPGIRVWYRLRRTDGQWSNQHLIGDCYHLTRPSIDVDSKDYIHVIWDTASSLKYTMIHDEILSTFPLPLQGTHPWIRVDQLDNKHVVWYGSSINYLKISPVGASFGPIELDSGPGREPTLAIDSQGNPHVVWYRWWSDDDREICYRKFSDGTPDPNTITINGETSTRAENPHVTISPDDTINVVWIDAEDYNSSGTDSDLFYRKCVDGTWSNIEVLTPESSNNSSAASMETDLSGHIHLSWVDYDDVTGDSGTDWDAFYRSTIPLTATVDIDPKTIN